MIEKSTSAEAKPEIERFTNEQKKALKRLGFSRIYPFTGLSIRNWREKGKPFWSTWYQDPQFAEFENMPSKLSEVAINPNQLFLPNSNRKTLEEQEAMIKRFSKELATKVPGVKAVIEEAPDYVELAFQHLERTGEYLFGKKYNFYSTRTKTIIFGSFVINIGDFHLRGGLDISGSYRDRRRDDLWVSPLVMPA